jgi:cytochrome c biogenesis protein CcdA
VTAPPSRRAPMRWSVAVAIVSFAAVLGLIVAVTAPPFDGTAAAAQRTMAGIVVAAGLVLAVLAWLIVGLYERPRTRPHLVADLDLASEPDAPTTPPGGTS